MPRNPNYTLKSCKVSFTKSQHYFSYLFENYGHGTFQSIDTNIRKQTAQYLPVISITEINFGQSGMDESLLAISIVYSIPAIAESDLIEFTISCSVARTINPPPKIVSGRVVNTSIELS